MIRWARVSILGCLFVGCGAMGASVGGPGSGARAGASGLAEALPAGADTCAVARPGAVAPPRRGLLRPLSQAGPVAWMGGVSVTAQSWASRTYHDGSRAAVGLLRVDDPEEVVRARLASASALRLAWDGAPCDPPDCGMRARFVDGRTVRLEQGKWHHGSAPGVERRCVELVRANPGALEVAARAPAPLAADLKEHRPPYVERVLRPAGEGVRLEGRRVLPSEGAAFTSWWRERAEGSGFARRAAADAWAEPRGRVVVSSHAFTFEDLALAAQDARRMRRARKEAARWEARGEGSGKPEVEDPEAVRQEVSRRRRALRDATGATRRRMVRDLRSLLERAAEAHPDETWLAHRLVRLLLDELGEAEDAVSVVREVLPRVPDPERSRWRRLWREALAHRGPDHLAPLLVDHGVAAPERAPRAARDLAALVRGDTDYEWLEGAWALAETLGDHAEPLQAVEPAELPLDTFVATLRATANLAVRDVGPHALYVLARGEAVQPADPPSDTCLSFHGADGEPTCFAAVQDQDGASASHQTMPFGLGRGPFELRAHLVPLPAGEGWQVRHLRLRGRVHDDALFIEEASASGGDLGWERVRRYLALPLGTPETRAHPAPELWVEAEDEARATRLLRAAGPVEGLTCRMEGHRLRCDVGDPARAPVPVRALTSMVAPVLSPVARSLWKPIDLEGDRARRAGRIQRLTLL